MADKRSGYQLPSEEEEFKELVLKNGAWLKRIAFVSTNNAHDAEDACQMVWERVWAHRGQELSAPFKSWVSRILKSVVIDDHRWKTRIKRGGDQTFCDAVEALPSTDGDAIGETLRTEKIKQVRQALGECSAEDQEVLYLFYWEEKTAAEIAAVLGLNLETAKKRIQRAREELKLKLIPTATEQG